MDYLLKKATAIAANLEEIKNSVKKGTATLADKAILIKLGHWEMPWKTEADDWDDVGNEEWGNGDEPENYWYPDRRRSRFCSSQCESVLEWFALSDSDFRADPFNVKSALERWGEEWLLYSELYSSFGDGLSDSPTVEDVSTGFREIPAPSIFEGKFSRLFINSKCEMFGIRSVFGGWVQIPPEEYQTEEQFRTTLVFREKMAKKHRME